MAVPRSKDNDAQPVLVDWGVVSPLGHDHLPFTQGLQENRLAIAPESFPPLGPVPVGRVHGIPAVAGEDRSITFLRACLDQLRPTLDHLSRHVPPERRGVCAATSKGSLLAFLNADPDERRRDFSRWLANDPALVLAREADVRGPSQAFVGACATGLANIHRAVEYIEAGWCDLALGGSTEATLHPTYLASFQNLGALAPTGCYPFDVRHEGFVAAEGAALFLFARHDIAVASGLRPLARVAGYAAASDAFHAVAIDASGASIERVARLALARAGWKPAEVDWICAHGTATAANDRAEAAALNRIFAQSCKHQPPVVSIKTALGHVMGAAGAVELAACAAALDGGFIPGNPGFQSLAAECHGLNVPTKPLDRRWKRVLKLSFGFGGHLVAMALEAVA
jgi:3-oxoacyl-[acyl-carrier-protein] synthase II